MFKKITITTMFAIAALMSCFALTVDAQAGDYHGKHHVKKHYHEEHYHEDGYKKHYHYDGHKKYYHSHKKHKPYYKKIVKGHKVYNCKFWSKHHYNCEFSHYKKKHHGKKFFFTFHGKGHHGKHRKHY